MTRIQRRSATAAERCSAAIFELAETGLGVTHEALARHTGVSRSDLKRVLYRLRRQGIVTSAGPLALTERGRDVAQDLVRRRRLAECLLSDLLGLSWAEIRPDLYGWMAAMSPELEDATARALGRPRRCPHGNPIPGSDDAPPAVRAAAQLSSHPCEGETLT